uniref:Uncharacterized protein n=1 Tax=Anguilla anguilla TaxID=7936 RepID=A0A0E9WUD6_ANGAN
MNGYFLLQLQGTTFAHPYAEVGHPPRNHNGLVYAAPLSAAVILMHKGQNMGAWPINNSVQVQNTEAAFDTYLQSQPLESTSFLLCIEGIEKNSAFNPTASLPILQME